MRSYLYRVAVLAILLTGVDAAQAQYQLEGSVMESGTTTRIAGARMEFLDPASGDTLSETVTTDANGSFVVIFASNVGVEVKSDESEIPEIVTISPNPMSYSDAEVVIRYRAPSNWGTPIAELYDVAGRRLSAPQGLAAGVYMVQLAFPRSDHVLSRMLVSQGGSPKISVERSLSTTAPSSAHKIAEKRIFRYTVRKAGFAHLDAQVELESGLTVFSDIMMSPSNAGNVVVGTTISVLEVTASATGDSLVIEQPGSPLDGLAFGIPSGAYESPRELQIGYAPIEEHVLGDAFNPVTPLIRVDVGQDFAVLPMTLSIPVDIDQDEIAVAFTYDELTGELEGLPIISSDQDHIVIASRHFQGSDAAGKQANSLAGAAIVVSTLSTAALDALGILNTGYTPGIDDWEFPNYGAYPSAGGSCAGQSLSAAWYFYERKSKGEPSLNGLFDIVNRPDGTTWLDNPLGIRLASVSQQFYSNTNRWAENFINNVSKIASHRDQYYAFLYALYLTGEPQIVALYRTDAANNRIAGHAVLVTGADPVSGRLFVADPNYPGRTDLFIPFDGETLGPYDTRQNAADPVHSYTEILYFAKSALAEWSGLGALWDEFDAGTIGDSGLYAFPSSEVKRLVSTPFGDVIEPIGDVMYTSDPTVSFLSECSDCTIHETGTQDRVVTYVVNAVGDVLVQSSAATSGITEVNIQANETVIGIATLARTNATSAKIDFLNFRWVTIRRAAQVFITSDVENGEYAPILIPGSVGRPYKLIARSFGLMPSDARYEWDFDDGSGTQTIVGDSTVTHSFQDEGSFSVTVTVRDEPGSEIGAGSAIAIVQYFLGPFQVINVEATGSTGTMDGFAARAAVETAGLMGMVPSRTKLYIDEQLGGIWEATLWYESVGGDFDLVLASLFDPDKPNATDVVDEYVRNGNIRTGRSVFSVGTSQQKALGWIESRMEQVGDVITGTLTIFGRNWVQDSQTGAVTLQSSGEHSYSFQAIKD